MSKRFILKLILFALPLALSFSMVVGLAVYSGEAMPIEMVVAMQLQDPTILYDPNSHENIFAYKVAMINQRQPEVIITGSSRVTLFTEDFLNKSPELFYNAGGLSWELREIEALVDQFDEQNKPEILVIGVDQFLFNATEWERGQLPSLSTDTTFNPQYTAAATRGVWKKLATGEISLPQLFNPVSPLTDHRALGLFALTNERGFVADGSLRSGVSRTEEAAENRRVRSVRRFERGETFIQPGDEVSAEALAQLDSILSKAKALGIEVVGFAPPFLPEVYEQVSGYGFYQPAMVEIAQIFETHGFSFYDLTDVASVGGIREDMLDFVHPSPELSHKLWMYMVNQHRDLFEGYVE